MTQKVLESVSCVFRSIERYVHRSASGLPVDSDIIRNNEEYEFSKRLVNYLLGGSYIPKGVKKDNALIVLKSYRLSVKSASQISGVTDLTLRQVYLASRLVEDSLKAQFNGSLIKLWESREFASIEEAMTYDVSELQKLRDLLHGYEGIHSLVSAFRGDKSTVRLSTVLGEMLDYDTSFIDSALEGYQYLKELSLDLKTVDGTCLDNFMKLATLLDSGSAIPLSLSRDLLERDPFNVRSDSEYLRELDSKGIPVGLSSAVDGGIS